MSMLVYYALYLVEIRNAVTEYIPPVFTAAWMLSMKAVSDTMVILDGDATLKNTMIFILYFFMMLMVVIILYVEVSRADYLNDLKYESRTMMVVIRHLHKAFKFNDYLHLFNLSTMWLSFTLAVSEVPLMMIMGSSDYLTLSRFCCLGVGIGCAKLFDTRVQHIKLKATGGANDSTKTPPPPSSLPEPSSQPNNESVAVVTPHDDDQQAPTVPNLAVYIPYSVIACWMGFSEFIQTLDVSCYVSLIGITAALLCDILFGYKSAVEKNDSNLLEILYDDKQEPVSFRVKKSFVMLSWWRCIITIIVIFTSHRYPLHCMCGIGGDDARIPAVGAMQTMVAACSSAIVYYVVRNAVPMLSGGREIIDALRHEEEIAEHETRCMSCKSETINEIESIDVAVELNTTPKEPIDGDGDQLDDNDAIRRRNVVNENDTVI